MKLTSALRTVAVVAGSALVASVAAVVPASAATSAPLTYTCDGPPFSPYTFKVTADTTLPETAPPGAALTATATYTVVIPDNLRNLMYAIGGRNVEGTAAIGATAFGAAATLNGTVPKTAVPASGDLTVVASSPVKATAPATAGAHQVVAGNFTTAIKVTREDGTTASEQNVSCVLDAGQNAVVDTLTVDAAAPAPPVTKADTATTAKAAYAKKAKKATVKLTVTGADGTPGTGKVKVTMKAGKKTRTVNATLNASGKAKAVFAKVSKKGKYVFTATYAGSDTQNASKKKVVLKVK
jgi:hypothetical protein